MSSKIGKGCLDSYLEIFEYIDIVMIIFLRIFGDIIFCSGVTLNSTSGSDVFFLSVARPALDYYLFADLYR